MSRNVLYVKTVKKQRAGQMETRKFNVSGMSCGGCSGRLKKVLEKADGVASADASHEQSSCEVAFDPAVIGADKLVALIEGANFKVEN